MYHKVQSVISQGSKVSTLKGPPEALWSTLHLMWISALSAPLTDGHPGCAPTLLCLRSCSLLLIISPVLQIMCFIWLLGKLPVVPSAAGCQCPAPCGLGFQIPGWQQQGPELFFFLPGAISSPFPPLGRVQGSHLLVTLLYSVCGYLPALDCKSLDSSPSTP